jgi:regulator of replication initiation timing
MNFYLIDPKEMLIKEMRGQIKEMDEELQSTIKQNAQLQLAVNKRKLKIDTLHKENKHLRYWYL